MLISLSSFRLFASGRSRSDERERVTRLLELEDVHEDAEHDDRDGGPDVDAEPLSDRVLQFRDRVCEGVGREREDAVCLIDV